MTKLNQPQSSSNKGVFGFKNGALSVWLAIAMMFSSCGKKTEQKLNDHDTKFTKSEQIDSLQTVAITEHTDILESIVKKLNEQWVKIENMDSLNTVQTEAITKLYGQDEEFKKQIDQLNTIVGKCCDATVQDAPKKQPKKAPKTNHTIEDENTPSDTTKTVKQGPKKDGEAFSF